MIRALVFDSGVGGLSIVDAIANAGLDLEIDYLADSAWLPYGEKSPEALRERVPALLAGALARRPADAVVIACNTASTHALDAARSAIAAPVVGVVPPVKPAAALTRNGVIGVLATAATIASPYLDNLIARHAGHVRVVRVAAPDLVGAAESKLAGAPAGEALVARAIAPLFADAGARPDVVALACTHFPLLIDELRAAAPCEVRWLDSGAAIARRLAEVAGARPGITRLAAPSATAPSASLARAAANRGFAQPLAVAGA